MTRVSTARVPGAPTLRATASAVPHARSVASVSNHLQQRVQVAQTRLAVNTPGDAYEREADEVADRVMRTTAVSAAPPRLSRVADSAQRACAACADEDRRSGLVQRDTRSPYALEEGTITETDEQPVQAKPVGAAVAPVAPSLGKRMGQLASGGSRLSRGVRGVMESRLGRDLGAVRVHTGSLADSLARSINARAFALGADVVFASGQYQPGSREGAQLLAHELVHVAQQGRAPLVRHDALPSSDRPYDISSKADPRRAWRVRWNPNTATGRRVKPWGVGPDGEVRRAATDAGTGLDIWFPDDGTTYWCHGYTFRGATARGGPYSIWGSDVPTVLADDGWQRVDSCVASNDDILVFWNRDGELTHSGRIRSVFEPGGKVDESTSTLESKWGSGPHNTSSWATNVGKYGRYRAYSKSPAYGPCSSHGDNERP